ncbi:Hypothetical protein, putative [Bodo saltans]|uniref:Uncharacterized protein n=1 Tax=Bodo saltans TaxID=75058 RepID=A0A0S4IKD8_BODSA|nr:Hypothetical protein, putative [Bodo saltans]|eukprot:CUE65928.1 Hypothetical protein, putative [Bodo saltans]
MLSKAATSNSLLGISSSRSRTLCSNKCTSSQDTRGLCTSNPLSSSRHTNSASPQPSRLKIKLDLEGEGEHLVPELVLVVDEIHEGKRGRYFAREVDTFILTE